MEILIALVIMFVVAGVYGTMETNRKVREAAGGNEEAHRRLREINARLQQAGHAPITDGEEAVRLGLRGRTPEEIAALQRQWGDRALSSEQRRQLRKGKKAKS